MIHLLLFFSKSYISSYNTQCIKINPKIFFMINFSEGSFANLGWGDLQSKAIIFFDNFNGDSF